jgi:DNA repair exonuclease SbcCD ATPase subunit
MPKKELVPAAAAATLAERRDIDVITAEIQFYKTQAGEAILEIGKRLNEAKDQLDHGEWLDWLRDRVEFSDATAQRFMRLAREYTNPSPVTDLGSSKALILLALPPDEREAFADETHAVNGEDKTVSDMSKRELEKAVRERAEALEREAVANAARAEAERIAEESKKALHAAEDRIADAKATAEMREKEANLLAAELERLENTEPVPAEEPGQQTFEDLKKEAAKAAKKEAEEKLKKKIADADAAKATADKKVSDAQSERDRVKQEADREKAAAAEKIAQLEKRLLAASSESVTIFKTQFENAQGCVNSMLGCIMKLKDDPAMRDKLSAALRALCEKTIQGLPVPKPEAPYGPEEREDNHG